MQFCVCISVDLRIFFDCLLAGIRGGCIKYRATKKHLFKQEWEFLKNKIASINHLINLKENPPTEILDKIEKLMDLKSDLVEKNGKDDVCKHRAKILL